MLKKIIAVLSSVAIMASSVVAFAASTEGSPEYPYGNKYIKHPLLKFITDSTGFDNNKQTNPENWAAHVTETKSYSGSKSLYMDRCNSWWKQFFHHNYCDMTEANSNVNAGSEHYVNPKGKNVEFSMKLAGDFSHMPGKSDSYPNGFAGLLDTDGIQVGFNMMNVTTETVDGVEWRTYSWSGTWPGTGWILGIGGIHACGAYIDDLYLKCGDTVVIDENFENAVNTDLSTVDSVKAVANENAVRLSWTNPYFADLTKLEVYDVTDGANTQVLSLTAADTADAPNVVFTKNTNCYIDIADAAAASKQYKIVTSTAYFADVTSTVDYTYIAPELDPEPEPEPDEEVSDTAPYGTMYVNNPYFRFYRDGDLWENKQTTPESYAAHISEQKSYSGDKSLYMYCCNTWWRQYFHTNYGCNIQKSAVTSEPEPGVYYIHPVNKTIEFSMKLAGDFSHMPPNAGLCDTSGIKVKFSEMTISAIEDIDGVTWRTYTWKGTWPGTGWILGMSGTHACGAYIDDIYVKVNDTVVINEDFETSTNISIKSVTGANVTPVNDSILRIGWTNPYMADLTKLEIYDITDGANTNVLSLTAADTAVAPNVTFATNKKCAFDVKGLEAETYKKYKIVASTAYFADVVTVVEGRTMKADNTIVSYNYDEKGFSFGGPWMANVGDSNAADIISQGKWSVDFNEKRSGNASFKLNHYGTEARLQYYLVDANGAERTLIAGTPYTFEAWVKTGDNLPNASANLFLLNGGAVAKATVLGKIKEGDWQKLSFTFTPEANMVITNLKFAFYAPFGPTEIYVDDITFSSPSDSIILGTYSDASVRTDKASINVAGGQKSVTWKYSLLDSDTAGTVGFNVYHIAEDGTETKLNDAVVEIYEAVDSTLSFNIDTLLPGRYEIRLISSLGFEGGAISTTVDDVTVSEGIFKTVYWNEGFNQYGENYDEGMSFDADMLTSYGDTVGTISVTNYSDEHPDGLPVCLVGALYKDGNLVNVVMNPTTTVAYGEIATLSVAFETSAISDLAGYEMKLLLWDAATGMNPLTTVAPSIAGPVAE